MTVFAPALSSLWRQVEDAGLEPGPLFTEHGVAGETIFDPAARIPIPLADRIMADAAARTGDPCFGLREAAYFQPTHIGALGFAWLASGTLHNALLRLQRYIGAVNDKLTVALREDGDELVIEVQEQYASLNAYQRDTASLAILVRMCRFICGDHWSPLRATIAHPEPDDTSRFYAWFRCPVDFSARGNCLRIDRIVAEERVTGGNEHLATLNDHVVVRYLAHRSRGDLVNRTRAAILDCLAEGALSENRIAEELNLSARQLNRRLKDEGTNFSGLLLACRRELAEQYIGDSAVSLTEIAYLLGFAEASSFSRAYRRWTGRSPSEARARAVPPAPHQ